jgi:hypothetical protein
LLANISPEMIKELAQAHDDMVERLAKQAKENGIERD